jgi:hypothetical protein
MAIQDEIAAAEAALASVQAAIARVQTLMAGPGGSSPGLAATLATLQTRETALQIQLTNLRAAAVIVRPPAATRGRPTRGAPKPGPRAAGEAAPSAKSVMAFARSATALADVTLETIAGSAGRPAARRGRKIAKKR